MLCLFSHARWAFVEPDAACNQILYLHIFELDCLLLLSCKSSLYILDKVFLKVYDLKYFLPFCELS